MYDPVVGLFVTADIIVQNFSDPQSLNRYSYCLNNPLYYSDPSGHFPWVAVGLLILKAAIITSATNAAYAAITGGDVGQAALTGAISGAFIVAGGAIGGAAAGAINSCITGGDVGQGALWGGIGAAVGIASGMTFAGIENPVLQATVSIGVGGSISGGLAELSGGDFGQGFMSGAFGAVCAPVINCIYKNLSNWDWPGCPGHSGYRGDKYFDYNLQDRGKSAPTLGGSPEKHFEELTTAEAEVRSAIENQSVEGFSRGMHDVQDYFFHNGKGYVWAPFRALRSLGLGHAFDGTAPDYDINAYKQAAAKTDYWVTQWEKKWGPIPTN